MGKTAFGFTLIELLVVIAIMAVTGVYVLANYNSFGEDRKLKNAVLDTQNFLRLAQTNATSGVKCPDGQAVVAWAVKIYQNDKRLELRCQFGEGPLGISDPIKKLSFSSAYPNVEFYQFSGITCSDNFSINFAPLYGTMTSANCPHSSVSVSIYLKNNKVNPDCSDADLSKCKEVIAEPGGRIYVQ